MKLLPPHEPTTVEPIHVVDPITIDGVVYRYTIHWNSRAAAWYLDFFDANGEALFVGQKLVVDYPIAWRHTGRKLPGQLVVLDVSSSGEPCTQADLGHRCVLAYIPKSELTGKAPDAPTFVFDPI
ncbi:MAG: hypothetical protein COW42_13950 [Deltaproteobacteria bacterium CG17_big_fil_post_rev_8_21_14_2_50_63_7]|nr:MAG: hypothetical protein COW42_13950 [Deltaproteobacteria bacterium CG17_big_fil_post_rev_8_21_14_2_50_63_7]